MYDTCPKCRYDLTGLDRDEVRLCPECGAETSHFAIIVVHRRRRQRLWKLFYLSPVLALPGCAGYAVGQPILSMVLCTFFAYRAMVLEDRIHNRDPLRGAAAVQAVLSSAAWTAAGTAILTAVIGFIMAASGRYT